MKKLIIIFESILVLFLIFSCSTPGSEGSYGEKESSKKNIREIVKKAEITPLKIDANGTVNIKVFLKEDFPEINYICIYLYSPRELINNEGIVLWESLNYDDAEKCFIGTINIDNYHESGIWKIGGIWIEDINNNGYSYEINSLISPEFYILRHNSEDQYKLTDLQIKELNVVNTKPDLEFPVMLGDYSIKPDKIEGSGIATIIIKAKDNEGGSGIIDVYAGIKTENRDGSQSIQTSGFYDHDKGLYICNINLENSDQKGDWYIDEIELRDYAGNEITYKYDRHKSNNNLMKYISNNDDNYEVTGFIIKSLIKN